MGVSPRSSAAVQRQATTAHRHPNPSPPQNLAGCNLLGYPLANAAGNANTRATREQSINCWRRFCDADRKPLVLAPPRADETQAQQQLRDFCDWMVIVCGFKATTVRQRLYEIPRHHREELKLSLRVDATTRAHLKQRCKQCPPAAIKAVISGECLSHIVAVLDNDKFTSAPSTQRHALPSPPCFGQAVSCRFHASASNTRLCGVSSVSSRPSLVLSVSPS